MQVLGRVAWVRTFFHRERLMMSSQAGPLSPHVHANNDSAIYGNRRDCHPASNLPKSMGKNELASLD